jgi:peptidoglycan/LPS O-acetylase OafA/YrhL
MSSTVPKLFRQDIQQLRGIAVLAVIVNHLGVDWLPGGYLGVDVFFVVSGYVITHSMLTGNTQATSRLRFFAQFWVRRVFRLWPMLFATVLATSALLIVTGLGRPGPLITGASALVGAANFRLLFGRLEYFALDTGSDWFMHTWSLAVEEQVYLVLSLIFAAFGGGARLLGSPRRLGVITACIGTLTALSLAASLAPFTTELVRFYSPHTRLYQIGAGALLALLAARSTSRTASPSTRIKQAIVFIGLAGLFAQFFTDVAAGATASLVSTVLTTLVLASATSLQHSTGFVRGRWLSAIGDRSYALYLVHWPVQLLWATLVTSPVWLVFGSVSTTMVVGVAAYHLVENRTRHAWRNLRLRRASGIAIAGLMVTVVATGSAYAYVELSTRPPVSETPDARCDRENAAIWVIGDSHLGAIAPAIAQSVARNCVVIGGYGVVIDFQDLARDAGGQRSLRVKLLPVQWLLGQIRSAETPPESLVIVHFLSAFLSAPQTAPNSADFVSTEWQAPDGSPVSREEFLTLFQSNLQQIASALNEHGGSLIVTSPPPDFDWIRYPLDATQCGRAVGRICNQYRTEATITRAQHDARGLEVRRLLNDTAMKAANFVHLPLDQPFCDERECSNFLDGNPLYMDDDHLNFSGAKIVQPLFQELFDRVLPRGPQKLQCPANGSVFACRVRTGGGLTDNYSTPAKFVTAPTSSVVVSQLSHKDTFGNTYCIALNDAGEASFVAGACSD